MVGTLHPGPRAGGLPRNPVVAGADREESEHGDRVDGTRYDGDGVADRGRADHQGQPRDRGHIGGVVVDDPAQSWADVSRRVQQRAHRTYGTVTSRVHSVTGKA